jgi:hypothetical protein
MFQGATVTRQEIEVLRQVKKVIRAGHVTHIDRDAIVLEEGSAPIGADWLCVDCSAPGLRKRPPVPIFEQDRITLQYVTFGGRPPYSAAITARIELEYEDDASKNAMCQPLPMRSDLIDLPRNMLGDLKVRHLWSRSPALRSWMVGSRLDQTMGVASTIDPADHAKVAVLNRYQKNVGPARSRLEKLMAASDPQSCGAASPSPN